MIHTLDANREQLVTDLAADYSEQMIAGKDVSTEEYLDKLPDDSCRKAFKTLANMSRFIAGIEAIRQDEANPTNTGDAFKSLPASI